MRGVASISKPASVTVYVTMCFAIIVSLITVMIHSVRTAGAETIVVGASALAMDSSFALFERELLEKYGILLFDGGEGNNELHEQALADAIKQNITCNLGNGEGLLFFRGHDFFGIEIDSVELKEIITPQQKCGLLWRTMAVDYEKCDAALSFAENITGYEEENKKCQEVMKAVKVMEPCYEAVSDVQVCYMELAELVDGVVINDGGINYDEIKVRSQFIKHLVSREPFEITKENISINSDVVYNTISNKVIDFNGFFSIIINTYEKVQNGDKSQKENLTAYTKILKRYLEDIKKLNEQALSYNEKMKKCQEEVNSSVETARIQMDDMKESIEGDTYQSFIKDLEDLKEYSDMAQSENLQPVFAVISNNIVVLENTIKLCGNINTNDKTDMENKYRDYLAAQQMIKGYRTDGMYIDYSKIPNKASSENSSVLQRLKKFVNDGVLSLCLPDGATVSEKKICYSDLASDYSVRGNRSSYIDDVALDVANEAIFNYYLINHCTSFVQPGESLLSYELEYIFSGKDDDRTNLSNAVLGVYACRMVFNTAYAFSNEQMRSEALTLATALVGFSGIYALVKSAQYLILTAWAAGESIMDVKRLLSGKKVPLLKNENGWQLSLEKLLKFNLDISDKSGNNGSGIENQQDNKWGWKYETYLAALLLVKDRQETAFRSMDVVELYMISHGAATFRLKNYVYGLEAEVKYHLGNSKKTYIEKCAYLY